jgi:hypothetical protein
MDISGSGITTPFRVQIEPNFRPVYERALKWAMCSSGKWVAADRGAASDIYTTEIEVTGYESEINDILVNLYNNRCASSGTPNLLTLTNFAETEKIFGEDIDYASVNATITDIGERQQRAYSSWIIRLQLQAISPTFVGTAAASITLAHWDHEYTGDNERTITKYDSYNGAFSYIDHRADRGVFKGTAYIKNSDMVTFLRTLADKRAAPITTTISGVGFPFGAERVGTWPRNLKYLEVQDMGYWGLHYHRVNIKAVEDL